MSALAYTSALSEMDTHIAKMNENDDMNFWLRPEVMEAMKDCSENAPIEPEMVIACKTCPYYRKDSKDEFGACFRFPPQLMRTRKEDRESRFPDVKEDWWCGEHPDFIRQMFEKRGKELS